MILLFCIFSWRMNINYHISIENFTFTRTVGAINSTVSNTRYDNYRFSFIFRIPTPSISASTTASSPTFLRTPLLGGSVFHALYIITSNIRIMHISTRAEWHKFFMRLPHSGSCDARIPGAVCHPWAESSISRQVINWRLYGMVRTVNWVTVVLARGQ